MNKQRSETITVADVAGQLESLAPLSLQESYDNCGLLAGEAATIVTGILVSLDLTEAVVDEAIRRGCNLIVSHHPLIFTGLKSITGKHWVERTLLKAIRNHICLYAIHTNLDQVAAGVNQAFAQQLGLVKTKMLAPKKGLLRKLVTFVPTAEAAALRSALFAAGAGEIGRYDQASFNVTGTGTYRPLAGARPSVGQVGVLSSENETRVEVLYEAYKESRILKALFASHSYEEVAYDIYELENRHQEIGSGMLGELEKPLPVSDFLQRLKNNFGGSVRYTHPVAEKVQKIAICGGSGSFLLETAVAAGADVLVTADFKYHQFLEADNRILIADIGHFESEQFTINLLATYLSENFTNFATLSTETKTNPVNYL